MIRGHCQVCARDQAVIHGHMSNHGYTVEGGYFEGVCRGRYFPPMEQDRAETDRTAEFLQNAIVSKRVTLHSYTKGEGCPNRIQTGPFFSSPWVSWDSATPDQRKRGLMYITTQLEREIRLGEQLRTMLLSIADAVAGKPLREVFR